MCEPIFTTCESEMSICETVCQHDRGFTLPLNQDDCTCQSSRLAQFSNQIQYEIAKDAKMNAVNRESCCDSCTRCTLQHLPDYHNIDFNGKCEQDNFVSEICDELENPCIAQDRDLTCAGKHFVTFNIDNDPGSADSFEPMMIDESCHGLGAYIRQILKGNSSRNAIYGINFEPYYAHDKKSKKNPYEVLYPSVIENLLNKLLSRSDLSPEDLRQFSKFISIASRLNVQDLNAYFRMLRARGVVLADVVENFQKQFWQLKSVIMSPKDVAHFLRNVKHAVLFGDPKEAKERKLQAADRLAKALEYALQQAEQWAKELLSKKMTWSSGKALVDTTIDTGKIENKTEPKLTTPIQTKTDTTQAIKEAVKPTAELIIRKDTDPKFVLKKEPSLSKGSDSTKKDDSLHRSQTATEQKATQVPPVRKDVTLKQKSKDKKSKKEKVATEERSAKQEEPSRLLSLEDKQKTTKGPAIQQGQVKPESSIQQGQVKPEPTASPQIATLSQKKQETPAVKGEKSRAGSRDKHDGTASRKIMPKGTPEEPSRATSQEPKKKDRTEIVSNVNTTQVTTDESMQRTKSKVDVPWYDDSKVFEQKSDFFRSEGLKDVQPETGADKIGARSIRNVREPERDFRLRLAAALSAAQKYAEKTLYVPDPHGVEDSPRSQKRFTTADILETDAKALLRHSGSKFYNDSSQLFERFSFLSNGAHQPGYYEPWDVEFPWPDIQELVTYMAKFYVKRVPDPNFSYRRGMEHYQALFRREAEESTFTSEKEKKGLSKKVK